MRIVSLLPSATEIVCSLGLRDSLVGVTHECDFPDWVSALPKVTRTLIPHDASSADIDRLVRERLQYQRALYTLDMPVLEALRPDLIVTQTLCDVCAVAEEEVRDAVCGLPGQPRVLNLEPTTLGDVLASIRQVGEATDNPEVGKSVVDDLQARIDAVARKAARLDKKPRVVLLEWIDPPFTCGHWSPELVRLAGGVEQLGREGQPSRSVKWEEVAASQPEVMVLACCGFSMARTMEDWPRLQSYPGWNDLPCVQNERIYLVDGSAFFSRPGPRLVESLEMLGHALHPAEIGLPEKTTLAVRLNGAGQPVRTEGNPNL